MAIEWSRYGKENRKFFGNICQRKSWYRWLTAPIGCLATNLIVSYQIFVSPGLPQQCRFYPSCSHYALEAFQAYGPLTALVLTLGRVVRCNPWTKKVGADPLPSPETLGKRIPFGLSRL